MEELEAWYDNEYHKNEIPQNETKQMRTTQAFVRQSMDFAFDFKLPTFKFNDNHMIFQGINAEQMDDIDKTERKEII